MHALVSLHDKIFDLVDRAGTWLLPLGARFVFAATLLVYYWNSGLTKLGDGVLGIFSPSIGAYSQIFPKQLEAAGYDVSQFGIFQWAVVMAGTYAEFILPLLIVIGLFTRLASLGMIGFVVVQSLTDVYGHGATDLKTLGAWFDRFSDGVILDQRLFWVFVLSILVIKGAGALSVDALLRSRRAQPVMA
ncbi:DoxX family protein [Phaeobacter italicus]|jgi:putative oxidoreductase|uniref:DoxX n=1 Tax=Phaeobacter italicus TaxID=481446 RepID=A0A0H5CWD8_9RHOB|nr:DoxX family protein [Phaeobacter italicus]EEB72810.1 DoxX [Ruegeria sp. R11]MEC8014716.1 DoxX family protein [Pseudomonadota bacterium]MBO9441468.1 DoxX family protein [Phaeobacter italicus]MBY5976855.1 DoxX family protein [Phaeobacter italicus]MBY6044546.1 DoxX family protein [Phaeobacter italicus]|mmetsp:Transcript_19062/g.21444  ORF Transcript_19062/g.21444 Transcript_19062/m.21444 type:complete len:189 (+) Transcript_19062:77-643(+)